MLLILSMASEVKDLNVKNKFEQLYYIYSKYLYAIGYHILKDEHLAADALQQCYFKVFQNIEKVGDLHSRQTKSFLSVIMRNESIMIYNKNKSIAELTGSMDTELYIEDETANIEEILARAELKKELDVYLSRLNKEEGNLLILKYLKEYTHEEIAELLDLSQDAVRQKLSRTRKKLAAIITEAGGIEN